MNKKRSFLERHSFESNHIAFRDKRTDKWINIFMSYPDALQTDSRSYKPKYDVIMSDGSRLVLDNLKAAIREVEIHGR